MRVDKWYKEVEYLIHLNKTEKDYMIRILRFSPYLDDNVKNFVKELKRYLEDL